VITHYVIEVSARVARGSGGVAYGQKFFGPYLTEGRAQTVARTLEWHYRRHLPSRLPFRLVATVMPIHNDVTVPQTLALWRNHPMFSDVLAEIPLAD
jgi:hypothetical protein